MQDPKLFWVLHLAGPRGIVGPALSRTQGPIGRWVMVRWEARPKAVGSWLWGPMLLDLGEVGGKAHRYWILVAGSWCVGGCYFYYFFRFYTRQEPTLNWVLHRQDPMLFWILHTSGSKAILGLALAWPRVIVGHAPNMTQHPHGSCTRQEDPKLFWVLHMLGTKAIVGPALCRTKRYFRSCTRHDPTPN